ncbi:MAG: hypothetical protein QOH29_3088, partial [Actinomycetota bacterium]|nr:hypothetical protein [Actinomycetota bacterium]
RGTTETGVKVRVGVQLDSGELQRLERVLWAAGFHVINQVARFSMRAALAHVED